VIYGTHRTHHCGVRNNAFGLPALSELFVVADSIADDKLDKLIRLFKTSSLDFFALHGNAWNIVNTAARRRKDKGK
jgi:hypothetical protein